MKQAFNIIIFFTILAIPFALSSQTRKAIPAGRYEALSGVKNSRSLRSLDSVSDEKKEPMGLFWNEVVKHTSNNSQTLTYFTKGNINSFSGNTLNNKGLKEVSSISEKTDLVFSDNLKRDLNFLNDLKSKKSLVVLKDALELKDVVASLGKFEVLLYQAEANSHYFLLKLK